MAITDMPLFRSELGCEKTGALLRERIKYPKLRETSQFIKEKEFGIRISVK